MGAGCSAVAASVEAALLGREEGDAEREGAAEGDAEDEAEAEAEGVAGAAAGRIGLPSNCIDSQTFCTWSAFKRSWGKRSVCVEHTKSFPLASNRPR